MKIFNKRKYFKMSLHLTTQTRRKYMHVVVKHDRNIFLKLEIFY